MTVYISGALHAAADLSAARGKYHELASLLRERGVEPYVPHEHTDPVRDAALEPASVFQKDWEKLSSCSLVVAFLEEPSLGVGAEIAMAIGRRIRVLGVLPKGRTTSRYVTGLLEASDCGEILEYCSLTEVASRLERVLRDSSSSARLLDDTRLQCQISDARNEHLLSRQD